MLVVVVDPKPPPPNADVVPGAGAGVPNALVPPNVGAGEGAPNAEAPGVPPKVDVCVVPKADGDGAGAPNGDEFVVDPNAEVAGDAPNPPEDAVDDDPNVLPPVEPKPDVEGAPNPPPANK